MQAHVHTHRHTHPHTHTHTKIKIVAIKEKAKETINLGEIELGGQGKEEAEVILPSLAPHTAFCTSQA